MARAYAAYLVNDETKKHTWVAALHDDTRNKWVVVIAWGKLGTVHKESVYDKDFSGQRNAEGYAKAITKTKLEEGFTRHWDSDDPADADEDGDVPEWWSEAICANNDHSQKLGKLDVAVNRSAGRGPGKWAPKTPAVPVKPPTKTDDDEDDDDSPKTKGASLEELKDRMAKKVKIEAGKAKIAVKQPVKEEEEKRDVPRPRFGYAPRK